MGRSDIALTQITGTRSRFTPRWFAFWAFMLTLVDGVSAGAPAVGCPHCNIYACCKSNTADLQPFSQLMLRCKVKKRNVPFSLTITKTTGWKTLLNVSNNVFQKKKNLFNYKSKTKVIFPPAFAAVLLSLALTPEGSANVASHILTNRTRFWRGRRTHFCGRDAGEGCCDRETVAAQP